VPWCRRGGAPAPLGAAARGGGWVLPAGRSGRAAVTRDRLCPQAAATRSARGKGSVTAFGDGGDDPGLFMKLLRPTSSEFAYRNSLAGPHYWKRASRGASSFAVRRVNS